MGVHKKICSNLYGRPNPTKAKICRWYGIFPAKFNLAKRESILTLCVYFAGSMPVSLHIFYGSAWSIGRSSLGSFLLLLILLRMTGFIGSAKAVEIEFLIVLLLWFVDLDKIVIIV